MQRLGRMFQRGSLTLFRVRGVPVRAHWTLLLILPYLAYVMSVQFGAITRAAGVSPDAVVFPPVVWGVLLAIGLFASVLLHEGAHVVLARRYGGQVKGITLMMLGGVSQITRMPPRPRNEALMALAGPATSLVLGGVLVGLYRALSGPPDLVMGLFYLGSLNVILGVFNLLPAFPMDGGRILRAILASRMGPVRATQIAASVGRVLAVAFGIFGLLSGNFLLVLIAIFIYAGAGAEAEGEEAKAALAGLTARDLVPPHGPATIALDEPLAEALPRMHGVGRPELLVVDARGVAVAVLHANDLAPIPPGMRLGMPVAELVPGLAGRAVMIEGSAPASEALETAAEGGARYVVVVTESGRPVGLISATDIGTMIALRLAEARSAPPGLRRSVMSPR